MSIIIEKLNYIYNHKTPFYKQALSDIDLIIEDGEFLGIIGHTGSGKSTLVQHLNALIKPTSGKIIIDGQDITQKGVDLKQLRGMVGMVFQYPEYQLFAETVFDDVAFGIKNFYKADKKRSKRQKKANSDESMLTPELLEQLVKDAIDLVGLDYEQVKDKSPFELSGGQKRRVAIAGVVATKPKVLILDEPTAGLDPQGKQEVLKLIHRLKADCSPTVIMISHDMNEIARNCTRVAVLSEGKIVSLSTPEQLFKDYDSVIKVGMDVPDAVKILAGLNKCGIRTEGISFSAAELADIIYSAVKGGKASKSGVQPGDTGNTERGDS